MKECPICNNEVNKYRCFKEPKLWINQELDHKIYESRWLYKFLICIDYQAYEKNKLNANNSCEHSYVWIVKGIAKFIKKRKSKNCLNCNKETTKQDF